MYQSQQLDILISGGGVVGLLCAAYLSQQPCFRDRKILILEAKTQAHHLEDQRRYALSRSTLDVLDELGILNQILCSALAIDEIVVTKRYGFARSLLSKEADDHRPLGYSVFYRDLFSLLLNYVDKHPHIDYFQSSSIQSIIQHYYDHDQTHWQLSVDQANQLTTYQTPLLVIAEGHGAHTLNLLGIHSMQHDYQQQAAVAIWHAHSFEQHQVLESFGAHQSLAMLPVNDHQVSTICVFDQASDYQDDLGFYQSWIKRRVILESLVKNIQYFPLVYSEVTESVRSGLIVMGNAAHTLHPIAGQGFNLSVRDIVALATLINYIWQTKQTYSMNLLSMYQQQRQTDQTRIVAFCQTLISTFFRSTSIAQCATSMLLQGFDLSRSAKHYLAHQVLSVRPSTIKQDMLTRLHTSSQMNEGVTQ